MELWLLGIQILRQGDFFDINYDFFSGSSNLVLGEPVWGGGGNAL